MGFTCPDGTTAQVDPTTSQVLYCYDPAGNVSYPPSSDPITGTPSAPGAAPSGIADLNLITQDFLTAWRTITAPQVAPGSIGVSGTVGPAGVALQGSPVLLLGLIAVVYLLVRK